MIANALIFLCWGCAALVAYSYAIYPALVYLAARLLGSKPAPPAQGNDADLPYISLLIAAYNEEAVIGRRIENALEMDYPREKLEIVVASDGSDDGTCEVVRRYESGNVRLLDFPQRRGKANVLNDALSQIPSPIVLLSDANTFTDAVAAKALVRWFSDEQVGAVCGKLVLTDPASGKNVDSLYWKYETFLKIQESRLGALLGSNGAIYAIRRQQFCPIPNNTIVDDFVIPLLIKQRHGSRIIYDCDAVAYEETAPDVAGEFRRRARIGAGGWQAIGILWRLLNPARGWVAFSFLSHKILRWLCPFFLLVLMLSTLLLARRPLYQGLLLAQVLLYVAAFVGVFVPRRFPLSRLLRLANMFVGMNAALFVGFFRWARGPQTGMWKRTRRVGES
jgi:cellulose synthase/poly-beta-1,6-N-acetylglucosamine synthase-like glycosyltransferase